MPQDASESMFRGKTVNRVPPGENDMRQQEKSPLTGELTKAARDTVRFLEGTDGQAYMTELFGNLAEFRRAELEQAVEQLQAAGIVVTDPGFGETVVRLIPPFTEVVEVADETIPKEDGS